MNRSAARMGFWLLTAAPAMVLGSLRFHAGGAAAALLLWMGLGAALPGKRPQYPYPRKRRVGLHRLFFCCGAVLFCIGGAEAAFRFFGLPVWDGSLSPPLFSIGCVCLSLPVGRAAFRLRLPSWLCWGLGGALCAFFLWFTVG